MLNTPFLPLFKAFSSTKRTSITHFSYLSRMTEKKKKNTLTKKYTKKIWQFQNFFVPLHPHLRESALIG